MNRLYQTYDDSVEFLFVYVREGPHRDMLPPAAAAEGIWEKIARGLDRYKISFPCLMGNREIEKAYTPFPERLVILDRDGRIILDAGLGMPCGWDLRRVESCLMALKRGEPFMPQQHH